MTLEAFNIPSLPQIPTQQEVGPSNENLTRIEKIKDEFSLQAHGQQRESDVNPINM